ncbi:MAG: hypothetical protein MUF51_01735 [Vicinamibacteria bacterium]|jgi:hypothetical protein|nr:hypothetical protein [Vicinamibacteria bacterium]
MRTIRARAVSVLILMALLALTVAERWRCRDEPLDRDVATYAVVGREMNQGRALYSDLFDHKPPAIYALFALAERLGADGETAIFLVNAFGAGLALISFFLLGEKRAGGYGAWAAIMAVPLLYSPALLANQPNTEVFINAGLALALLFALSESSTLRTAVGCGAFLALASLFKHSLIALVPLWALYEIFRARGTRREGVRRAIALCLPALAAWLLVTAYFAATARARALYETLVVFNASYAGGLAHNLIAGLAPEALWPRAAVFLLPLIAFALFGWLSAILRRDRSAWPLLMYCASIYFLVASPGRFYAHYYQLWIPALLFGSLLAHATLTRCVQRAWSTALLAVLAASLWIPHLRDLRLDGEQLSRVKYGEMFIQTRMRSREIERWLEPETSLYVWGIEPGFYFYTRKRPPSGVLWCQHALEGPLRESFGARILADLKRTRPDLIVFDTRWSDLAGTRHPVVAFIEQHYLAAPPGSERNPYRFFVRPGSGLRRRMAE